MKNTLLFKHTKLGLLLAFVLFTSLGWGQTALFVDDFTGTAGTNLTANGWVAHSGSGSTPITIVSPGLTYSNYLSSGLGNGTSASANGEDINKGFTSTNSGSIYYSFMVNASPTVNTTDYTIHLTQTSGASAAGFFAKIFIQKDATTGNLRFGLSKIAASGSASYTNYNYSTGTTYLIVVKYTFNTGSTTDDSVYLWVNPTTGGIESAPTVSIPAEGGTDATGLAAIAIRQFATSTLARFDGIRVGKTWSSVTPASSTTWNGTTWSNGVPILTSDAIIDGDFSSTASGITAGFTSKTLTVNATKSFTINTGHNITVAGAITNNGTFTVANNANLVQTNTIAVTNTGNIIVNKDSASIQLFDYTLWSSPVAEQKLKAFSPDTVDARFYSYNSATNLYNVVPAPLTTDFAIATGYLIRTPNTWTAATPTTFNGVFTGVPNNGDISILGLVSGNYYAVGNPYPSTISVADFYTANPNAGTLYFWRKTNGVVGTAYATRNSAGSTSASGGLTPSADIAVGQGFFVSPSAAMTLNFTNAMRATPSTSAVFLRTASEERNRFWLNLTNTTGLFSQMLVGYMPEATSGVDNAIDGRYINDAPTALTSLINAEEYTIQGRALPFTTTDMVPLGFKTDAAGNYTIAIDHVDGLFSTGQTIYLKDNLLNTVVDLSAGSYSFASAIGTFNSRFEVHFQGALSVNNPTFTASSVVAFGENGEIKINSGSTIMEHVSVYDLQGRLLAEKKQVNATETKIQTTALNQVLLVKIIATNGSKITKKIIQ